MDMVVFGQRDFYGHWRKANVHPLEQYEEFLSSE
jgi:hypothetical protein